MAKCLRRKKRCRECGYRFSKDEYDLWKCPECGEDRHCQNPVEKEGEACRLHGGKSLKGMNHPNYSHGRYSKHIPSNLLESYKDFRSDDERVSVEEELDLARMILADQINKMGDGASGENWKKAKETFDKALRYNRQNRSEDFIRTLVDLGEILKAGEEEVGRAKEALGTMETVRRLVNTERQIMVDQAEYLTRAYVLFMFGKILDALERHVAPLKGGRSAIGSIADTIGGMAGSMADRTTKLDEWSGS